MALKLGRRTTTFFAFFTRLDGDAAQRRHFEQYCCHANSLAAARTKRCSRRL